jgi:hypothetical protein
MKNPAASNGVSEGDDPKASPPNVFIGGPGNIKKLYEGKVVSSGFSDQLAKVLPEMVKALFEDFPGQSGRTRASSQVTDSTAVFGDFL